MARSFDILGLLAEDKELITYRPRLTTLTGSVTAAILLQQTLFHWRQKGREPFYKFKEPCQHPLYRHGDSWVEQLGFTAYEFDGAIGRIGQKLTKGTKKDHSALIHYWTTADRSTYYRVNETALQTTLLDLYRLETPSGTYMENSRLHKKAGNSRLDITETTPERKTLPSKGKAISVGSRGSTRAAKIQPGMQFIDGGEE